MTQRTAMRLPRPLRSIRLHAVPKEQEKAPERVRWLLDLNARAEREREHAERTVQALETCVAAVVQAAAGVPAQVQAQLDSVAAMATELGLALAREVVGELVDQHLTDPVDTVKRCLVEATHGATTSSLRVLLSPEDHGAVTERLADCPEVGGRLTDAEILPDHELQHGCVRVETDSGRAMYDPIEVIDRICAEVRKGIGS